MATFSGQSVSPFGDAMITLPPGSYTIEMTCGSEISGVFFNLYWYDLVGVTELKEVGGYRIKTITSDATTGVPVIKRYEYDSVKISGRPNYLYTHLQENFIPDLQTYRDCFYHAQSTTSLVSLGLFGATAVYPSVNVYTDAKEKGYTRNVFTHVGGTTGSWSCPFGTVLANDWVDGLPKQIIDFTGQLFDESLGWNTYQMKWRTMDPQIGRFLQVDPLASDYVHNSTYAYAENDVIRAIDLEGLEKYIIVNEAPVRSGPIQRTHVTTTTDSMGNLKDQHVKSPSGKLRTDQEFYTYNFDNINGGKSTAGKVSHADRFIAKNGKIGVETREGYSQTFGEKPATRDETDPIKKGEKLINSEGFQRTLNSTNLGTSLQVTGAVIGQFKWKLKRMRSM